MSEEVGVGSMDDALIIFVRNPIPGRVKTRLAADIGAQKAEDVYRQLLLHTYQLTQTLSIKKYVYYSDFIPDADIWDTDCYEKRTQVGEDLGQRMQHALNAVLGAHTHVVLIGSDTADLDKETLIESYESLHFVDVVVGPATDGGYYLLGCKKPHLQIFDNIAWSTDEVFSDTRHHLLGHLLDFKILQKKSDIDTLQDLQRLGWNSP